MKVNSHHHPPTLGKISLSNSLSFLFLSFSSSLVSATSLPHKDFFPLLIVVWSVTSHTGWFKCLPQSLSHSLSGSLSLSHSLYLSLTLSLTRDSTQISPGSFLSLSLSLSMFHFQEEIVSRERERHTRERKKEKERN